MRYLALILTVCYVANSYGQPSVKYLNQTPPSTTPEVFAPGLISQNNEYEFGSVFNADFTEFFYGVEGQNASEIRYSQRTPGGWTDPVVMLQHPRHGHNDPFLSPDEQRLYFISQRAKDGDGPPEDYDIWYVERQGKGWSEPINAGPNINTGGNEYYISFTAEGTMYFGSNREDSNFDIYASAMKDGEFQTAVRLPGAVNTKYYEADVFVDPQERYLIFCAQRPHGLGEGDLYISFKNTDGSWTESKNMGAPINSTGHELCPFVSADGKYLFYTSRQDIYWVDTKVIWDMQED